MKARWMDPETGRFISPDPAKDGLNWYVYCSNNPTTMVDPTGLETWWEAWTSGGDTFSERWDSWWGGGGREDYWSDRASDNPNDLFASQMDSWLKSGDDFKSRFDNWFGGGEKDNWLKSIGVNPGKEKGPDGRYNNLPDWVELNALRWGYDPFKHYDYIRTSMGLDPEYMDKYGKSEYGNTRDNDLPFRYDFNLPFKPINYIPVTLIGNKIPYVYGSSINPSIDLNDLLLKKEIDLGIIKENDPEAWEYISNLFTGKPDADVYEVGIKIEACRAIDNYGSSSSSTISMEDIIHGLQWEKPTQLEQALMCLGVVAAFAGPAILLETGALEMGASGIMATKTWITGMALKYGPVIGYGIGQAYEYLKDLGIKFYLNPAGQAIFNPNWNKEGYTAAEVYWRIGVQALIQATPQIILGIPTQNLDNDPVGMTSTVIQGINDKINEKK